MGSFKTLAICIAVFGAVVAAGAEESLARHKRQIPVQNLPTFPPDVERTSDGVPILEESYLDSTDRPAARFFAQFEQPTTDSEGLRLYEGLWATGGRNEPRSLDHVSDPFGENGIQPHHRQSAAWSSKKETKRYSSSRSGKRIQVRSGGTVHDDDEDLPASLLPSGFGPSTGPKFSEEVTYRRSNSGRRNSGNLATRSLGSTRAGNNGLTCVLCRTSSANSGNTGSSSSQSSSSAAASHHQVRSLGHASEESQPSPAAHGETEGLRLYNKWLSQSQSQSRRGSSRNQLRSLDNAEEDLLGLNSDTNNGILPHHRRSGSWSRREERRHSSRRTSKTITVRNGGTGAAELPPSGFGESTGPKFSEEVTYRRNGGESSSNNANTGLQTRSLSTARRTNQNGENGYSCVTCRRASSSSSGNQNQVRTLDTVPAAQSAAQSHTSEAWSENEERRHHQSRSSSASNSRAVPPNGGEVRITDLENRGDMYPPNESEEVTYRRASSGRRGPGGCALTTATNVVSEEDSSATTAAETTNGSTRRYNCTRYAARSNGNSNTQTRSASTNGASNYACRSCDTRSSSSLRTLDSSGSSAAASHRSSRVPSTRSFPPVQRFGQGDGEVEARVLHSDDSESQASANGGVDSEAANGSSSSGKKVKKAYYRRTVFKNYSTAAYPASVETWLGA